MEASESRATILIIDDTPANLRLLESMLREVGYDVRPAPSGRLALRAAKNNPPDLVLLDITMPEMDGYEVCGEFKADPKLADIPIIFISALDEPSDKVKALRAGGVDYISKPFQIEEVRARVSTHLALRRYQRELTDRNRVLKEALDTLARTQANLVHTEKMASLGVLTAGIAHELNNPINAVRASALALQKILAPARAAIQKIGGADLLEGFDELSTNIVTGTERVAGIVEGLQIFARRDEGSKKQVDLHQNIDATLSLLGHQLGAAEIEVERDYGELPSILCWPGQLNQVFMNVLSNAIDAVATNPSDRRKRILVTTRRLTEERRDLVRVEVHDNGGGIPDDIRANVFEPFFTTKDVGKGTGLGLAISHGIMESHGGSLEVVDGKQPGTTFSITLPTAQPQEGQG